MSQSSYIDEISRKLDIVEVIKDYLPGLKKSGKNYKTLCPFHSEKTASFTVNQEKQMFYCFGCGAGGNMFNFIMKMENLTFFEAAKRLASKAGVIIDDTDVKSLTPLDKEKITIKKIMEEASAFFQKYLKSSNGKEALDYLKARNVKDETIRNFLIGLSPDGDDELILELKKKNFDKNLILKSGLARMREDGKIVDYFKDRIMFPIRDYSGQVVAFGARTLKNDNPKYLNSSENPLFSKRRILYGLYESLANIRKDKKILIVEGYMDVIILHQYGINFSISSLGTSFTHEQAQIIKRYCDEAFILFDPDAAGTSSAIKAGEIMIEKGIYPRICNIKQNKDPDEFIIEEGFEEFVSLLKNSKDIIDFKISLIKERKTEIKTYEKSKMVSYLLATVVKQNDDIIKSEWLKKIAVNFNIGENILLNYMKKVKYKDDEEAKINLKEDEIPLIEVGFIHSLLKEPALVEFIPDFKAEYLESNFAKLLFNYIKDAGQNLKINKLCEEYPQYSSIIVKLYMEEIRSNINPSLNILKTVEMIKENFYLRRWKYLKDNVNSLTPEEMKEFLEITKIVKGKK